MPGVSSHFDHTLGRAVMGQQVLNLGYSCEHGFVPLDSEIFISNVKAQGLYKEFQEGRSTEPGISQQEIHLNSSPNGSCHHTFGHLWFSKLLRLKVPFANNTTTLLKFFVAN
jgi:hypothetical protein